MPDSSVFSVLAFLLVIVIAGGIYGWRRHRRTVNTHETLVQRHEAALAQASTQRREAERLRTELARLAPLRELTSEAIARVESGSLLMPLTLSFERLLSERGLAGDGLQLTQLFAPAHHDELEARLALLQSGASIFEQLECALAPKQRGVDERWFEVTLQVTKVGGTSATWLRLAERTALKELELLRDTSAAALHSIVEAVVVLNDDTDVIVWANPAFEAFSGWRTKDVLGRALADVLKSQPVDEPMPSTLELVASNGMWQGEFRSVTAAGDVLVEKRTVSLVEDEVRQSTRQVVVFKDLAEEMLTHEHLQVLSQVDVATELPNLYGFLSALRQKLLDRATERLCVVHLDFHGCEALRETQGTIGVDAALRRIAAKLSRSLGDEKLLSRVGPAQLAFVLPTVQMPAIEQVLRAINAMLQAEQRATGDDLYTAVSIGVAPGGEGVSAENLLHAAQLTSARLDATAKVNLGYFNDKLKAETVRRLAVETALRDALRERPSELVLHFQPKVNPYRQTLVGFEGLCRWKGALGSVSPAEFIPAAERTGLIYALGERTFDYACSTLAQWRREGLRLRPIAVNVSAHQLSRETLAVEFLAICERHNIPPKLLELEVTESAIMADIESAARLLKRLRGAGFAIALDDFGTGQSSLSYLRTLPLDALKIDRSFISDIESREDAAAICRSILELGRTLHLKVIAEGVETAGQLDFLMKQQCDVIQGYVFSPAVPAVDAAEMLRDMPERVSTVMGGLDI